jgi:hypothetical protein
MLGSPDLTGIPGHGPEQATRAILDRLLPDASEQLQRQTSDPTRAWSPSSQSPDGRFEELRRVMVKGGVH